MKDIVKMGRWVGAALLASFAIGMLSNFKLQSDLFAGAGLLVNAATHPLQIGLVVCLGIFTSLMTLAVAALLFAIFRHRHPWLLTVYLALATAGLALSMIEYATLIAFRSLSEAYVAAGPDPDATFQAAKSVLNGLRNGIHFPDKFLGGVGVLVFFVFLHRARLLPRAITALGLLAAPIQMLGVALGLFGHDVPKLMLAPLALAFMLTAGWLLVRGFRPPLANAASVGGTQAKCVVEAASQDAIGSGIGANLDAGVR